MTIKMTPVDSSSIAAIGHDPILNVLKVQFKSGKTYHYHKVPADAHAALMNADSKGTHFSDRIRGNYDGVIA
jgi:hypothetical protein